MDEKAVVFQFAKDVKPGEGPTQMLVVRFVTEDGTEVLPTTPMRCPIGTEIVVTAPGLESGLKCGPVRIGAVKPGYCKPYLSFMGGYVVVKLPKMPNHPVEIEVIYQ